MAVKWRVRHVELIVPRSNFPSHYQVTLTCGHVAMFMATPSMANGLFFGTVTACSHCSWVDV